MRFWNKIWLFICIWNITTRLIVVVACHLSRVPPAVLSRNHITSKRLLLTGSLSEPSCSLGRKSTVWLAAFFVFFPQCAAWSQATLCTFLCRHCACTIATWKCIVLIFLRGCEHKTATSFFFSWTSIQSFRIRLQKKLPTFDELNEME